MLEMTLIMDHAINYKTILSVYKPMLGYSYNRIDRAIIYFLADNIILISIVLKSLTGPMRLFHLIIVKFAIFCEVQLEFIFKSKILKLEKRMKGLDWFQPPLSESKKAYL